MAIAPNTTFVSGAVLTAAQMNALPFGIVAQASSTTSNNSITSTEAVTITASTFTAIANRYYRITYIEPAAAPSTGVANYINLKIRLTNAAGTVYGQGQYQQETNNATNITVTVVALATFTAGSVVVVGSALVNGGTGNLQRSSEAIARIIVEDIGPA
jgi:hypothetical protein